MDTAEAKEAQTENRSAIDIGKCSPKLTDSPVGKKRSAYDIESLIGSRHLAEEKMPDATPPLASPPVDAMTSPVGSYGKCEIRLHYK